MIKHRPCGMCRALVPADTGCPHWRPNASVAATMSHRRRRRSREEVEHSRRDADQFRRMMGVQS